MFLDCFPASFLSLFAFKHLGPGSSKQARFGFPLRMLSLLGAPDVPPALTVPHPPPRFYAASWCRPSHSKLLADFLEIPPLSLSLLPLAFLKCGNLQVLLPLFHAGASHRLSLTEIGFLFEAFPITSLFFQSVFSLLFWSPGLLLFPNIPSTSRPLRLTLLLGRMD